jgi:hypothetical protein
MLKHERLQTVLVDPKIKRWRCSGVSNTPIWDCSRTSSLTPEVAVIIHDAAPALVVVAEAGVTPVAIALFTGCIQPRAVDTHIAAGRFIIAGRQASLPSTAVTSTCTALQVSIVIDDPAMAIVVVEGRCAPVAIPLLAARLHCVTI